jgi:hypothetical protein
VDDDDPAIDDARLLGANAIVVSFTVGGTVTRGRNRIHFRSPVHGPQVSGLKL